MDENLVQQSRAFLKSCEWSYCLLKFFLLFDFVLIVIDQMTSGFPPKKKERREQKVTAHFQTQSPQFFGNFIYCEKNVFNPKTS